MPFGIASAGGCATACRRWSISPTRRRHAEEGLGDVAAAGADQAGDAEDLAGAHLEGDVVEAAVERRFSTESTTSPIGTSPSGNIWVISRPTIIRMMLVAGHVPGVVGADIAAVAEHRHLVGDLEQLAHLVGDVDDAFALRLSVRMISKRWATSRRSGPKSARP